MGKLFSNDSHFQSLLSASRPSLLISLFGVAFFRGLATVFAYTSALSLFLIEFSADQLPIIYILAAVIIAATGFINLRLSNRRSPKSLFSIALLSLLVSGIILWATINQGAPPFYTFILLVWFRLLFALGNFIFWGTANQLLTLHQSKLLLGRISSGATIATIIAYAIVPFILNFISPLDLIILALISLIAMFFFVLMAFRHENPDKINVLLEFESDAPSLNVHQDSYLRSIFLISLFTAAIYFLIDFNFFSFVAVQFETADTLAVFISRFYTVVQLISFVTLSLLSAPILKRFGLRTSLLIFPVAIVAFSLLFFGANQLGAAAAALVIIVTLKGLDEVLQNGILIPAASLLYQPFQGRKKIFAQTVNDVIVIPIGIGVGGLLILLNTVGGVPPIVLLFITVTLALLMTGTIRSAFEGYINSLRRGLAMRRIRGRQLNLDNPETLAVIEQKLSSPHVGEAVYAIELLSRAEKFDVLNMALKGLLYHPDPLLRSEVSRRIAVFNMTPLIPFLQKRLEIEEDPEVQQSILEAMGTIGGTETINALVQLTEHQNDHIRFAALTGLLQSGIEESRMALSSKLDDLTASPLGIDRHLAARVIGAVGAPTHESQLLSLLNDEEPSVVQESLMAIGKLGRATSLPVLLKFLHRPVYRQHAIEALVLAGDLALPALEKEIAKNDRDSEYYATLFHVCGLIGTAKAAYVLQKNLLPANISTRETILESLHRIGYRMTPSTKPNLFQIIEEETRNFAFLKRVKQDVVDLESPHLMSALDGAIDQCRRRHNLAMSIFTHSNGILNAAQVIEKGTAAEQSRAHELLNLIIDAEKFPHGSFIATNSDDQRRLEKLLAWNNRPKQPSRIWLKYLLEEKNAGITPWLKGAVFYTIGLYYLRDLMPTSMDWHNYPSPIVRETALWAQIRLADNGQPTRGENQVLILIEKVMTLKSADVFSEIPEQTLSAVAEKTMERRMQAGNLLFEKGEYGSSMFVIVSGKLRVFDGDHTLNFLEERAVVGEMALLDPAPRSASVEAVEDTLLLELTSEMLELLIARNNTVAQGIIRVLTRHLRDRVNDLTDLRLKLNGN